MTKTVAHHAIEANLLALTKRLQASSELANEAHYNLSGGGTLNEAIGTILGFETQLAEAQALYQAIIALHRGA